MGKVRLEFLPSLAETLGIEPIVEEVIADAGTGSSRSLTDLLNRLGVKHQLFRQIVFDIDTQNLTGRVAVFLNGRSLDTASEPKTRLSDGDRLTFVPVIEGG